jgi:hypothetical protein
VGGLVHLQVAIISLPISRRVIDGYKGALHIHYKFSWSALGINSTSYTGFSKFFSKEVQNSSNLPLEKLISMG